MQVDEATPPAEFLAPSPPPPSAPARHTCIVSRLTSRECGNIKVAMRSLIAAFIGGAPDMLDDEEEDEGPMVRRCFPRQHTAFQLTSAP